MKKIHYFAIAFILLTLHVSTQAQKPNICVSATPGVTIETTGLSLSANRPTHGCKDTEQSITINAIDISSGDPNLAFLFDANVNASISDAFVTNNSFTKNIKGEIWVISKTTNPSSSGGHIIKCASIEIIETKRPDFEFTICGSLLSGGNTVVALNSPTNSAVNITHRVQSNPFFGNHPVDENKNTFTEEELQNNSNKRYVNLNIDQPNPIIVPIISTFISKQNPTLRCTGNIERFEANPAQKPIRITELATNDDKKGVSLKLEHQKENNSYKIDFRKFDESSYQNYGEFKSPIMVFSPPGDPIPQSLVLDKIALDPSTQYCFYAWEENVCALPNVQSPPIKSNEVCNIQLNSSFISGNKNLYKLRHEWNLSTTASNIISTEIRNLNVGFVSPIFPPSNTSQESVFPFNCADLSTYQVAQVLSESSSDLVRPRFDVTILSNPVPLNDIKIAKPTAPLLVSFAQNGAPEIELTILETGTFLGTTDLYEISYSIDTSSNKVSLGESTSLFQKHISLPNPTDQYCYTYVQKICAQTSQTSDEYCTIRSEETEEKFVISWTDFKPTISTGPILYDIEWVDADQDPTFDSPNSFGSPTEDLQANLESIFTANPDLSTALVRVFTRQAPSLGGNNGVSYSYPITLVRPLTLYFPNAFSPNNDGINDVFKPASLIKQDADLMIFNRLGKLIYKTTDVNSGWDGVNLQGKKVDSGMYTFIIRITNVDTTIQTQQGSFLVLY